jgi:hypothetical protein
MKIHIENKLRDNVMRFLNINGYSIFSLFLVLCVLAYCACATNNLQSAFHPVTPSWTAGINSVCTPGQATGCSVCNVDGTAWYDDNTRCLSGQICQNWACIASGSAVQTVIGSVDCSGISGWICDPNNPSMQYWVEFYLDETTTAGYLGWSGLANINLPAIASQCGGSAAHGFTFTIPARTQGNQLVNDGLAHNVHIAGKDSNGNGWYILAGSPKIIVCSDTTTTTTTTTTIRTTTTSTMQATTTTTTSSTTMLTTTSTSTSSSTSSTFQTPEICCNGIDDDGDGKEDGYDPDCAVNVSLASGTNNVCWWTEWNDYEKNRDYYSGVFSCPLGSSSLSVSFYQDTESNYDYFYAYNGATGALIYQGSGSLGNRSLGPLYNLSSIKFRFTSDSSVVRDGVKLNAINCSGSAATTTTTSISPSSSTTVLSTTTTSSSTTTTTVTTMSTTTTTSTTSSSSTSSTTLRKPGDANGDGYVDYDDLLILAASYGKNSTDAAYDARADFKADGRQLRQVKKS